MDEVQQLRLTVRTARPQDGVTGLALAGECDLYEANRVDTALEAVQMSDGLVLVDVSELRFVENEQLFEMSSGWHAEEEIHFFCECIDATCTRAVTMSSTEYKRMRSSSTGWVAISPAHSAEERSRVVEAGDCYLPMAVRSGGDG